MSCLWRAVSRVYCNKQHCTVHVCYMTWRKSLSLSGALNPAGAQRWRGDVRPRPRRAGCEAPPRRARLGVVPRRGTGSGRREGGFAHLQSARHTVRLVLSTVKFELRSSRFKGCANWESPLNKIKSPVSAPRPRAWLRFPRSPWAGRAGSPAPGPSPRAGTRLFVAGGSLGSAAARAQRGGRQEVGGTRLTEVSSTSGTHPFPAVRAPA